MPLSKEFIDSLIKEKDAPKRSTKLIRRSTQYAQLLPVGGFVKYHDFTGKSLRCASRGCSAPTCYTFKGIPYCTTHLIAYLNLELMRLGGLSEVDAA